jgi:hypothetical protein
MSGHRPNIALNELAHDCRAQYSRVPHPRCMLATGVQGRTLCNIARMCKYNGNPLSVAGAVCIVDCRETANGVS